MKFYQETTLWEDNTPNGVYLLDDAKEKMYAYVSPNSNIVKTFKNPIRISVRGRKFKVVKNTYGYTIPGEKTEHPRWEVIGSKGDKYYVTQTDNGLSCTCSGFKFRSECKHVTQIDRELGTSKTSERTLAKSQAPLVTSVKQISRRRTG
jgi:hypothetical protein